MMFQFIEKKSFLNGGENDTPFEQWSKDIS